MHTPLQNKKEGKQKLSWPPGQEISAEYQAITRLLWLPLQCKKLLKTLKGII